MKYYTIYSITITIALYLIVSFIKFDVLWILEVGKWDAYQRGLMVYGVLAKEGLWLSVYHILKNEGFFAEKGGKG